MIGLTNLPTATVYHGSAALSRLLASPLMSQGHSVTIGDREGQGGKGGLEELVQYVSYARDDVRRVKRVNTVDIIRGGHPPATSADACSRYVVFQFGAILGGLRDCTWPRTKTTPSRRVVSRSTTAS